MTLRHWLLLFATAASFASSILVNKVLVGSLFMGERLQATALVGMALILAGSVLVIGVGLRSTPAAQTG